MTLKYYMLPFTHKKIKIKLRNEKHPKPLCKKTNLGSSRYPCWMTFVSLASQTLPSPEPSLFQSTVTWEMRNNHFPEKMTEERKSTRCQLVRWGSPTMRFGGTPWRAEGDRLPGSILQESKVVCVCVVMMVVWKHNTDVQNFTPKLESEKRTSRAVNSLSERCSWTMYKRIGVFFASHADRPFENLRFTL